MSDGPGTSSFSSTPARINIKYFHVIYRWYVHIYKTIYRCVIWSLFTPKIWYYLIRFELLPCLLEGRIFPCNDLSQTLIVDRFLKAGNHEWHEKSYKISEVWKSLHRFSFKMSIKALALFSSVIITVRFTWKETKTVALIQGTTKGHNKKFQDT